MNLSLSMMQFLSKRKMIFAFHCIEKMGESTCLLGGNIYRVLAPYQRTSQQVGKTTRRPCAPAFAQHLASSLILSSSASIDGLALSKTHSFLCSQITQGTSSVNDCRALRSVGGVCAFARSHQSIMIISLAGGWAGICAQSRMMCKVCLANGHARSRCWMVSGSWSQRRHLGWCCRPQRASLDAVHSLI